MTASMQGPILLVWPESYPPPPDLDDDIPVPQEAAQSVQPWDRTPEPVLIDLLGSMGSGGVGCQSTAPLLQDIFTLEPVAVSVRWRDTKRFWAILYEQAREVGESDLADQILACPVIQNNGNSPDEWDPFHWSVIKDLRNTVMQHKFASHFAQSML